MNYLDESYFIGLAAAIAAKHSEIAAMDAHCNGVLSVLGEGFTIYATPGWEGDSTGLPIGVVYDDGEGDEESMADLAVAWTGDHDTDCALWLDAILQYVERARAEAERRTGKGSNQD